MKHHDRTEMGARIPESATRSRRKPVIQGERGRSRGKGVKADENSARGRLCCQKAQSPELTATGIALAPPRRGRTVVFRVASDNIKTAPSPHAAKDGGIEHLGAMASCRISSGAPTLCLPRARPVGTIGWCLVSA